MVSLLAAMDRHPHAAAFRTTLPIAADDGTLKNRMRGTRRRRPSRREDRHPPARQRARGIRHHARRQPPRLLDRGEPPHGGRRARDRRHRRDRRAPGGAARERCALALDRGRARGPRPAGLGDDRGADRARGVGGPRPRDRDVRRRPALDATVAAAAPRCRVPWMRASSTRRVGIDPTKTRPSNEALLRRVLKGEALYRVNTLVDALNLASLRHQLPFGLYDAARLRPPVLLRRGGRRRGLRGHPQGARERGRPPGPRRRGRRVRQPDLRLGALVDHARDARGARRLLRARGDRERAAPARRRRDGGAARPALRRRDDGGRAVPA